MTMCRVSSMVNGRKIFGLLGVIILLGLLSGCLHCHDCDSAPTKPIKHGDVTKYTTTTTEWDRGNDPVSTTEWTGPYAPEINHGSGSFDCEEEANTHGDGNQCLGFDLPVPPFAASGPRGYWRLRGCQNTPGNWCEHSAGGGLQSCTCQDAP